MQMLQLCFMKGSALTFPIVLLPTMSKLHYDTNDMQAHHETQQ